MPRAGEEGGIPPLFATIYNKLLVPDRLFFVSASQKPPKGTAPWKGVYKSKKKTAAWFFAQPGFPPFLVCEGARRVRVPATRARTHKTANKQKQKANNGSKGARMPAETTSRDKPSHL